MISLILFLAITALAWFALLGVDRLRERREFKHVSVLRAGVMTVNESRQRDPVARAMYGEESWIPLVLTQPSTAKRKLAGAMTINEARAQMNLPPIEGGSYVR